MIFNLFRLAGDLSHVASKLILMWSIHWNRSAEGVSLITQALYMLLFVCRYLDLFWTSPFGAWIYLWNFFFKLFYIASSAYIVFLMTSVFARTREREKAWKFGIYCLAGAVVLSIPVTAIFQKGPVVRQDADGKDVLMYRHHFKFTEILWTFSEILESVCVLPQLVLLRQTTVPTVIDSYYLLCLGSYRAFYILNWISRFADKNERYFDPISVLFGIIQTALYVDFAWVYFRRQRVKLRGGGVVDSDDLSRGWLVGRLAGKHADLEEEEPALRGLDDENGGSTRQDGRKNQRWGARGISISADEDLHQAHVNDEDAQPLADPTAFEDDLTDDEDLPPSRNAGVSDGSEWNEDADKRI
ncbi:ER lumen protein retaining receptor [Tothia fuscella]|uniref:ER lumen protein retaining receptor n=1 Tax=Tothia fuscella TaxID=1048955 RepID=A0A9P4NSG2_9PEZI|nr:ER lumen protein retaining receptor [Tothia fuscella]